MDDTVARDDVGLCHPGAVNRHSAAGYIDESIEFTEISEGAVSASSLDLPPGFKMVTDHGEFTRKTTPSGVGGFDD